MLYDITVPTHSELPVWKGDNKAQIWQSARIADGDICNVSNLKMGVHTGTHIDAPLHFVDGGKTTNEIPLSKLVGQCHVAELKGRKELTAQDLASLNILPNTEKLLLKTDNSDLWKDLSHPFYEDYCALTPDAAEWVRDRGIHLVGIDYLSISLFKDPPEIVHQILLRAEIVIIEALNLTDIPIGNYRLFCLPMKVKDVDGIPARVILEK